jgi:N-acetylmuramoyl-L-alanine amidase
MSRLLVIFIMSFIWLPLNTGELHGTTGQGDDPLDQRYDEAKFYYYQLQNNSTLSQSRENWLKGTRNFRRIYLSSPKSELAPACLFMLGRIYGDMYGRFHNDFDLEESAAYYKDVARLFPRHRLTDDSYFALAKISLEKQQAPEKAAEYLTEIITHHPDGDMYPSAEALLKSLSQEHDIPLPKVMVSSSRENKLNYVLPVKYWSSDNYTRVVVMASGPVTYKEELLKETANTPRRLYIDFQNSYIEPQYRAPVPIEDGLLRGIRTGQFAPDTVRVVLDIESIDSYKIFSLPDPFRVLIDVMGKTAEKELPTAKQTLLADKQKVIKSTAEKSTDPPRISLRSSKKKALSGSSPDTAVGTMTAADHQQQPLSLAQQLGLGVKKIVLDPGHGGKDPGAMAFGLKEKDIVLQIARKLAPILQEELGCEVVLTRNDDIFIPLEERTAIANTENADLFVSIHINAHPSASVRGLETYYLNLTTNAEAMRVAARENATSTHQMSDLQDILSDIMKNSKIDESSRLAQYVHNSILTEGPKNGFGNSKNLGVKQAPFYVLIGAQMPAILLEVAFITNQQDAQNLQNPTYLRHLAEDIAQGIRAYVQNTTAQLDF